MAGLGHSWAKRPSRRGRERSSRSQVFRAEWQAGASGNLSRNPAKPVGKKFSSRRYLVLVPPSCVSVSGWLTSGSHRWRERDRVRQGNTHARSCYVARRERRSHRAMTDDLMSEGGGGAGQRAPALSPMLEWVAASAAPGQSGLKPPRAIVARG